MDTIFAKVAGWDVHQKFITVGVRCRLDTGKLFAEVRTFGVTGRFKTSHSWALQNQP